MVATDRVKGQSNFAMFLRTGLRFRHASGADVEVKFNPWHDPDDGRFTFKGQGTYFEGGEASNASGGNRRSRGSGDTGGGRGGRSPAAGSMEARAQTEDAAIRRRNASLDPRHPSNYSLYKVRAGDTLTRIAAKRTGVTVADLAWLNGIRPDSELSIGQSVKLPNQASLDAGRDAFGVARGLADYMNRHGGRIPSGSGPIVDQLIADRTQVTKNGYTFERDGLLRTTISQGELSREISKPSSANQRAAGGTDRRGSDDGGHYIARRFNGPSDSVNLFAQDSNFNRGAYRRLEDQLAGYQRAGKRVYVRIVPYYRGISQRPYRIEYWWRVDGQWTRERFDNEKGGKGND